MAVLSFFGICFIFASFTLLKAEEHQTLELLCEAFPQLQICSSLPSAPASSPSSLTSDPSVQSSDKNEEVIKPMGYKASVLAKAFEPNRPSYMRFGKREFGDEIMPHSEGIYKKFGGKQKSSYMRFGKRSDAFE
uniref:Uncharacterized protein n=1 Tax=Panagrolaimus sp. PS1159 TaxID=55785 RepID=A0AC35FF75_9BILA